MRMPDRPSNDLSFLEGCWRTDPFRHSPNQGEPGVSNYCFDRDGRGTLTFRRSDRSCRAPAQARYGPDGSLRIVDSDTRCSDGSPWAADRLDCRPTANGVAACSGNSREPGSGAPTHWTVNLHRTGR
jgi:hypothetical protein